MTYMIYSRIIIASVIISLSTLCACSTKSVSSATEAVTLADKLHHTADSMIKSAKGTVGLAIITDSGDTITVNNNDNYPLMSVFKLHEAIAVAHCLDRRNQSFDSIINISRNNLSVQTWSPMLDDYPHDNFALTIGQLVKYMLLVSDNNASNELFDRVISVEQTDSFIRSLDIPHSFSLNVTERQMQLDHQLAVENHSSPLSCAALIRKVFTDSLVSTAKQDSICRWLGMCDSAPQRMSAGVAPFAGAKLYHRTGSGYTNERGEIAAVNDVGLIVLPDGTKTAIAILIKDYRGSQQEADSTIATISSSLLEIITQ